MVALMNEFPQVKVTFNLVPSLLVQLEAFADLRARDWHLDLGLKPAASLTDGDRSTMLSEFFHAPRARMIDLYPRYAELLQKRDRGGKYTDADFLDLQVWHKLAWVDPYYLDSDPRVQRLVRAQRNFTEDDKLELRAVELEILRRVIPEYRKAAERGQVELSTSPFYHPILPLLCDTDIYLRTHPTSGVPRPPFRHPEDAADQLCAGASMPCPPVRTRTGGPVAIGGVGVGCGCRARGTGRLPVDGNRRGDSRADHRPRVPARQPGPRRTAGTSVSPVCRRRRLSANSLSVQRPLVVRPHRLRVRRLGRGSGGRGLRQPQRRGRASGLRQPPVGKRPP